MLSSHFFPWRLAVGFAAVLLFVCGSAAHAQVEPKPAELTPQQRQELLAERDRLWEAAQRHATDGLTQEALTAYRRILDIERGVFGDVHEEVTGTLQNIGNIHEQLGDFQAAESVFRDLLRVASQLRGQDHYSAMDIRRRIELCADLQERTPEDRKRFAQAESADRRMMSLHGEQKMDEALKAAQEALAIRRKLFGQRHAKTAESLNNVGFLLRRLGEAGKAEPFVQQAAELRLEFLGGEHPDAILTLYELGAVHAQLKQFDTAEAELRRALAASQRVNTNEHWMTAMIAAELGGLFVARGDDGKAEPFLVKSLEICLRVWGPASGQTISKRIDLALAKARLGDFETAATLLRTNIAAHREEAQEDDPRTENFVKSMDLACGQMWAEVRALEDAGRLEEGIAAAEQVLTVEQSLHGEIKGRAFNWLDWVADSYEKLGNWDAVRGKRRQILELVKSRYDAKHWKVTDAQFDLKHADAVAGLDDDQRHELDRTDSLFKQSGRLNKSGNYADAILLVREVCEVRKAILGANSRGYAAAVHGLGRLQMKNGEYERAESSYSLALESYRSLLGNNHPSTAVLLGELAIVYYDIADYPRAERFYLQALDLKLKIHGEEHAETAASMNNLAYYYKKIAEHEKAEKLYLRALEVRKKIHGEDSPEVALVMDNIGLLYESMFRYDEAEKWIGTALNLRRQALGDEHFSTAESLNSLGWLYDGMGRYVEAEPLLLRALEIRRRVFGDRHPKVATSLSQLATLYSNMGRLDQAERYVRESMELHSKIVGRDHPSYAADLSILARLYSERGKYTKAEPILQQVKAIRAAVYGEESPAYAETLDDLGGLYRKLGDYAKAELFCQQAMDLRRKVVGETDQRYADSLHSMAELYLAMARFSEAEPLLQQAVELQKQAVGELHPSYVATLQSLASLHKNMGNYKKAKQFSARAVDTTEQTLGTEHPRYAERLNALATALENLGEFAAALDVQNRAIEVARKTLGEQHPGYAMYLNNLAYLHGRMGNYDQAGPLYEKSVEITANTLGKDHPIYSGRLNNLGTFFREMGRFREAEESFQQAIQVALRACGQNHPDYTIPLGNLAGLYNEMSRLDDAEPLWNQILTIDEQVYGKNHPRVANDLLSLADLYDSRDDFVEAERHCQRAVAILLDNLGPDHPDYANAVENLAGLYERLDDDRAEQLYRQALRVYEKQLGKHHSKYANTLSNLASVLDDQYRLAEAASLHEESLRINETIYGPDHPDVADCLDVVATHYEKMKDIAMEERLRLRAYEIRKKVYGEDHPNMAVSLIQLGSLYSGLREYERAESLCKRALAICRSVYGDESLVVANRQDALAHICLLKGDFEQAEDLLVKSLEVKRRLIGTGHQSTVGTMNYLAGARVCLGQFEEVESLYETMLSYYRDSRPADPDITGVLMNYGGYFRWIGQPEKAEPYFRESIDKTLRVLESSASVQTERQQLAMTSDVRFMLDAYLSLPAGKVTSDETSYEQVLRWKSLVSTRQRIARMAARDPRLKPVLDELQDVSNQLARMAYSAVIPDERSEWQQQVAELTDRKEKLERRLSAESAEFRQSISPVSVAAIRTALPPDVALVDCLVYTNMTRDAESNLKRKWEQRLVAFIVRGGRKVQRVELGPTEPLQAATHAWYDRHGVSERARTSGHFLRERFWMPLSTHLQSTEIVLISPDGFVNWIPFAALPDEQPDTYLLEQHLIGVVPSAHHLLQLQDSGPAAENGSRMLLLGGVDYGAQAVAAVENIAASGVQRRATRTDNAVFFSPLAGTRQEITNIEQTYRNYAGQTDVVKLEGQRASEQAFRQQAPQCRYLHIATHGFFAPEEYQSALDRNIDEIATTTFDLISDQSFSGHLPGLLSGIALAGANAQDSLPDDGILTATELEGCDLSAVELAVLSACETGLGRIAGGEGVLGLQRAFQIAGARTTVTSLWKVHDEATQLLMTRFYQNLWEKKMGKLAALREAQLWMLREVGNLQQDLPRGVVIEKDKRLAEEQRLPPYYWAAFVLSGDWR